MVGRVSQFAARHAAFTRAQKVQPLGRDFFEATSRLLSLRPDDLLTIPRMASSIDERFGFPLSLYSSYEVSDFYLGGLPPTEHISRLSFPGCTAILTPYAFLHSQTTKAFNGFALVDKSGNISMPTDYRDKYELLGTYTIIDPKGDQMHVTYASPGTAAYYRKTGKFPDGAVLVKEIFLTDHAKFTTGDAQWASQLVGSNWIDCCSGAIAWSSLFSFMKAMPSAVKARAFCGSICVVFRNTVCACSGRPRRNKIIPCK